MFNFKKSKIKEKDFVMSCGMCKIICESDRFYCGSIGFIKLDEEKFDKILQELRSGNHRIEIDGHLIKANKDKLKDCILMFEEAKKIKKERDI